MSRKILKFYDLDNKSNSRKYCIDIYVEIIWLVDHKNIYS